MKRLEFTLKDLVGIRGRYETKADCLKRVNAKLRTWLQDTTAMVWVGNHLYFSFTDEVIPFVKIEEEKKRTKKKKRKSK